MNNKNRITAIVVAKQTGKKKATIDRIKEIVAKGKRVTVLEGGGAWTEIDPIKQEITSFKPNKHQ